MLNYCVDCRPRIKTTHKNFLFVNQQVLAVQKEHSACDSIDKQLYEKHDIIFGHSKRLFTIEKLIFIFSFLFLLGREVVFQCRDEGPIRARVQWVRKNNRALPPGARDFNGRLEIPNIQVEHGGEYVCEASGYPKTTPGSSVTVSLTVEKCKYNLIFPFNL